MSETDNSDFSSFSEKIVNVYTSAPLIQEAFDRGYGNCAKRKPTCAASDLVEILKSEQVKCRIKGRLIQETPNTIVLREIRFTGKTLAESMLGTEPDFDETTRTLSIQKKLILYLEEVHMPEQWV
jgi:hypothetical protein